MFSAGYGQGEVVVVLCPEHVGYLGGAGWSKSDVKRYLHENAQRTVAEWVRARGTWRRMVEMRRRCWLPRSLRIALQCWLRAVLRVRSRR